MGFAKYHEDNVEMWTERQRDRRVPVYVGTSRIEMNSTLNKNDLRIPTQNLTAHTQHSDSTVYRTVPHRF